MEGQARSSPGRAARGQWGYAPLVTSSDIQFKREYLAHLLQDRRFVVPPYQRSYAWDEDQVHAFWNDLRTNLDRDGAGSDYFMGTVVAAKGAADERFTIIDGQQRLATTSLLLAAVRDAYHARNDDQRSEKIQASYLASFEMESATFRPHLLLNNEDREFFQSVVVDRQPQQPRIDSHRRLARAQEYLRRRLDEDLNAQDDWLGRAIEWERLLLKAVSVIAIDVPDEAEGFVIFETLNDRGAPLTISDLLRNYLMRTSGSDALPVVQEAWGGVLLSLGLQDEDSVFVDFLRQDWSSVHGATREKDLYREIRKETSTSQAAKAYAERLPGAALNYAALLDAQHEIWRNYPPELGESVGALLRLDLGQYRPLALAVLDTFDEDEQKRTFRALVSWAVRGLLSTKIGGGSAERAYGKAAIGVRAGRLTTSEDVLEQLLPIVPNDRDFSEAFAAASVPRTTVARYLMAAIERSQQQIARPELVGYDFSDNYRLQRIIPREADTENQWPEFTADELKAGASKLGNYVLLGDADGAVPKALTFAERRTLFASSYVSTTRAVAAYESWSPVAIAERQRTFANIACAVWPRNPRP